LRLRETLGYADENRFVARTLDAPYDAINLVRHVLRDVLGRASTRGIVTCHVPHHAAASRAINAAPKLFLADTSAQGSAAKRALKITASCAPVSEMPE
jgi:hypothetical protein